MFSETSLKKIEGFSASDPVVSLYLNTEPSGGNAETHRLRLRNLLKSLYLEKDVERITQFFEHEYDWSGRSVAVFSCTPAGFFEYLPVAIPIKDFIQVGSKAVIEPLVDQLQEYQNIGVVLVDQQGARFMHFNMGELVDQEGLMGHLIKNVKSGSSSSAHGFRGGTMDGARHIKEKVDSNLRRTLEFGEKYFARHRVKKIIIGGNEENVARFRAGLNKTLQGMVVGTLAMNMTATHTEIWNKILQLIR
jgi:hypothetical protein